MATTQRKATIYKPILASQLSSLDISRFPRLFEEMQARDAAVVAQSPSFSSYSNSDLTEIAARVVEECAAEEKSDEFYDEFYFEREVVGLESVRREGEEWDGDDHEDEGFEFEFVTRPDSESSPISADEIFHDGKIRPVYPFLDGDLLIRKVKMGESKEGSGKKMVRLPLMKLLIEERDTAASSCSSSDVDELEGVPEELYCVWQPKAASEADEQEISVPEELYCVWQPKPAPPADAGSPEETARRCKKSGSTGSVYKKLKLKELLRRSHSEGRKDNFVFLKPRNSKVEETAAPAGKLRPPPPRRTYLPYRQDLVGFFSGGNGFTKSSKPF